MISLLSSSTRMITQNSLDAALKFLLVIGTKKGGQLQVTKPIILVKICYKLLYVIQGVENW